MVATTLVRRASAASDAGSEVSATTTVPRRVNPVVQPTNQTDGVRVPVVWPEAPQLNQVRVAYLVQDRATCALYTLSVRLNPTAGALETAGATFSPGGLDKATAILLEEVPDPPATGDLLDLGCGWGPIALSLALDSPHATVWAVDVNERALDLVRRNSAALGLTNVNAALPHDVPDDIVFRTIRSNPPIRVGKHELHGLLERWIPRLDHRSDAWLVVQRNLGSDSLQRWLAASFPDGYSVQRAATGKGFRVLRVRKHGSVPTESVDIIS